MMYPEYTVKSSNTLMPDDADIRGIVQSILYGSEVERPRGRWMVIQKILYGSDGKPVKSPYRYKTSDEGKNDNRGHATTRTGYLCNEVLVRGMILPASRMIMDETQTPIANLTPTRDILIIAYTDQTKDIKDKDVVVLIDIDENGDIVNPVKATAELNIVKPYVKTLDSGRPEYIMFIIEDQK